MGDKISLAGDLGSGKSTVSHILTERLHLDYYSTGTVVRGMAAERGMTVVEFNEFMEKDPAFDRMIDDRLVALSDDPRGLIIDSRMAFHFVRDTFRVYFSTELETSAARILSAKRAEESFSTLEEMAENIRRRKMSERKRYKDFYGVDCKDLFQYALVVDTTYATPEEVALCVENAFAAWQKDRAYVGCFLSPLRPLYPEDTDTEAAAQFSERLALGESLPPVHVAEDDGTFYILQGEACAMAYAIAELPFVPCILEKAQKKSTDYVCMKNSL